MFFKLLQLYKGWYKAINLVLVVLAAVYIFYFPIFMQSGGCLASWCTYEARVGILNPLYEAQQYFIYLPLAFLFLPTIYFRRWLWYVASWSIPLMIALVSSTSVYSGAMMGDRDFNAFFLTILLLLLSGVVTIGFILYDVWRWYRTRKRT
jgi:hypothetical protein